MGQRKKSESPTGFKPRLGALSTELQRTHGEREHILGSYLTRVFTLIFINSLKGSSQENSQGN